MDLVHRRRRPSDARLGDGRDAREGVGSGQYAEWRMGRLALGDAASGKQHLQLATSPAPFNHQDTPSSWRFSA